MAHSHRNPSFTLLPDVSIYHLKHLGAANRGSFPTNGTQFHINNNEIFEIVENTPIPPTKRLTNHSGRKTVVKKLKKAAKIPETSIIKVTGHTNTRGLRSYDAGDEEEFREMSNALWEPKRKLARISTNAISMADAVIMPVPSPIVSSSTNGQMICLLTRNFRLTIAMLR